MQKWEYCRLRLATTAMGRDSEATAYFCDGTRPENFADIDAALYELGVSGWEVVSGGVSAYSYGNYVESYLLKRPL